MNRNVPQDYCSSHREFFHTNIDKYSALYLASKAVRCVHLIVV